MEITIHGAHQLALRFRSVKVFEGAMNVLTMRAVWDSGAGVAAGTVEGGVGAAAIFLSSFFSLLSDRWHSIRPAARRQAASDGRRDLR
jgi:hypothetical protein